MRITLVHALASVIAWTAQRLRSAVLDGQRATGTAEVAMLSMLAAGGVFAGVVITTGEEAAQQLENVTHSGLNRVSGAMEVRGSVIVTASGAPLKPQTISFSLGTFGNLRAISTDPSQGGLSVSYHDTQAAAANLPYTVRFSPGNNGDTSLDTGELVTVTVRVADIEAAAGKSVLLPGKKWTVELQTPSGPSLEFSRTQPSILSPVMAQR